MKKSIFLIMFFSLCLTALNAQDSSLVAMNSTTQIYNSTDTLVYRDAKAAKKEPKRLFKNQTLYIAVGESFSVLKDLTTGVEIGSWCLNDNPLAYSVVANFSHNFDSKYNSIYVGVKPYYYFFTKDAYGMYVYASPQFQAFNSDPSAKKFDFLLEYGFGGYYTVNKHLIISCGLGAQTIYSQVSSTGGKPFIPAFGITFNYLR